MTELQFLIKLLLDCPLDSGTKQLVADRIREVEGKITSYNTTGYITANNIAPTVNPVARELTRAFVQAPSTQRLLEQNPDLAANIPTPQPIVPIPRGVIDKETGTERIPTGNGTQGPRKWK